jgi:hypothetical protein
MSLEEPLSFTSHTIEFKRLTITLSVRWLVVKEAGSQKSYGDMHVVTALERTSGRPERMYAIFKTSDGAKRAFVGANIGTLKELQSRFESSPDFDQLELSVNGEPSWYD